MRSVMWTFLGEFDECIIPYLCLKNGVMEVIEFMYSYCIYLDFSTVI